ncbi:MAG: type II toxin-antitoxin system RelE/ParE family toxin [Saprospiraceae bacterium]|nr:type II toxin-antitoxin system RelE/ParE family toxin [Saprospiraceae bacterium]MCF8251172.1 type II toxin-antitoxin system RelE/ParE family toxin [Saprospiraceae bacterium]MCF8281895.1 type II toxin-antitoxin system RelE/ParE family toxin [Bacteroidales bacterium]MCF8312984.1 type II toxin-antitoxin system RelE/ParE family toxin [Saprospiraceae bacterium]MCF8441431.1 type II toxin-antitoxin system RelE/ParE family toxin [Saprospiraceae bacterium]
MSLPIIWSPASKDEFAELLQYVEVNFGLDATLKLLETTDKVLEGISEHPALFPASNKVPSIRKAVITKQTSLFYRITINHVQLLHFWDNRRNPDDLKFLV